MEAQEYSQQRSGVIVDKSVMELLLDCQHLYNGVRLWLEGKATVIKEKDNYQVVEEEDYSEPLANHEGVHKLQGWVRNIINEHSLQAIIPNHSIYNQKMEDLHTDLAESIFVNGEDWKIKPTYYNHICDTLIDMVGFILSRAVGGADHKRYMFGKEISQVIYTNDKRKAQEAKV